MSNPIETAKAALSEKAQRVLALRLRSYTLAQIDPEAAKRNALRAQGNDSDERSYIHDWHRKRDYTLGDALVNLVEAVSPVVRSGSSLVMASVDAAASHTQKLLTTLRKS